MVQLLDDDFCSNNTTAVKSMNSRQTLQLMGDTGFKLKCVSV